MTRQHSCRHRDRRVSLEITTLGVAPNIPCQMRDKSRSAGRLQMRHEKCRAPTYRPTAELSGAQSEIVSDAQFENVVGANCV
ncbi:hypothetical protein E2C01_045408 [Portunus trituberculatus]|uniref:Uncharacterized protein n=1 Tax=Portunus trituberculatus TaxID=210409 RepID=A0A5B7G1Z9_PORTR|nr:hypothetical protein [Portunus trituberculatus]